MSNSLSGYFGGSVTFEAPSAPAEMVAGVAHNIFAATGDIPSVAGMTTGFSRFYHAPQFGV